MFSIIRMIQNMFTIFSKNENRNDSPAISQEEHNEDHSPTVEDSQDKEAPPTEEKETKMITLEYLEQVFPNMKNKQEWLLLLNNLLQEHDIYTEKRISAFMAQCAHESANFNQLVENLNYSEGALLSVFGKYFDPSTAPEYARKPEKIANRVYANRMGNGSEETGDGWSYRGRGVIQLTGKNNYISFSASANIDVVNEPDLLCNSKGTALRSAIWFWHTNSLNRLADSGDFRALTRRINGGFNGLEDRQKYYRNSLDFFNKIK